jgi:NADPH-dependent 7-cyano-7-deazaguanine reductase QueF
VSRFLNSEVPEPDPEDPLFRALGEKEYVGLETFPNPGVEEVEYFSDEVMNVCPITGQPDFYKVWVTIRDSPYLIESKSLKLFYHDLMKRAFGTEDDGAFCEALAVHIGQMIFRTIAKDPKVRPGVVVRLEQKSRGGITITALAII